MEMEIWFKVFTGKKQRQVGQSIPEWTKLILWMKAFKKFEAEFTQSTLEYFVPNEIPALTKSMNMNI